VNRVIRWWEHAGCMGIDGFTEMHAAEARAFCALCPVPRACLSDAIAMECQGPPSLAHLATVRGGLSAANRVPLLRRR
jgi:hypothetical protein